MWSASGKSCGLMLFLKRGTDLHEVFPVKNKSVSQVVLQEFIPTGELPVLQLQTAFWSQSGLSPVAEQVALWVSFSLMDVSFKMTPIFYFWKDLKPKPDVCTKCSNLNRRTRCLSFTFTSCWQGDNVCHRLQKLSQINVTEIMPIAVSWSTSVVKVWWGLGK